MGDNTNDANSITITWEDDEDYIGSSSAQPLSNLESIVFEELMPDFSSSSHRNHADAKMTDVSSFQGGDECELSDETTTTDTSSGTLGDEPDAVMTDDSLSQGSEPVYPPFDPDIERTGLELMESPLNIRSFYYIAGFNRKGVFNPGNCNTYTTSLMYEYWRDCYENHGLAALKERCQSDAVKKPDQVGFIDFVKSKHNRGLIVWLPVEKGIFPTIKFKGFRFDHKLAKDKMRWQLGTTLKHVVKEIEERVHLQELSETCACPQIASVGMQLARADGTIFQDDRSLPVVQSEARTTTFSPQPEVDNQFWQSQTLHLPNRSFGEENVAKWQRKEIGNSGYIDFNDVWNIRIEESYQHDRHGTYVPSPGCVFVFGSVMQEIITIPGETKMFPIKRIDVSFEQGALAVETSVGGSIESQADLPPPPTHDDQVSSASSMFGQQYTSSSGPAFHSLSSHHDLPAAEEKHFQTKHVSDSTVQGAASPIISTVDTAAIPGSTSQNHGTASSSLKKKSAKSAFSFREVARRLPGLSKRAKAGTKKSSAKSTKQNKQESNSDAYLLRDGTTRQRSSVSSPKARSDSISSVVTKQFVWTFEEDASLLSKHKSSQVISRCFVKYDEKAMKKLETAYIKQKGKGKCEPLTGYVVDFTSFEQINILTGHKRKVRRIEIRAASPSAGAGSDDVVASEGSNDALPTTARSSSIRLSVLPTKPESLHTRSMSTTTNTAVNAEDGATWCWREDDMLLSRWDPSVRVGEGYVKYSEAASVILEAEYQRQGRNGTCSPIAGYTVNFASMEQTNDSTSYTRRIARIVKEVSNPIPSLTTTTASSMSLGVDSDSKLTLAVANSSKPRIKPVIPTRSISTTTNTAVNTEDGATWCWREDDMLLSRWDPSVRVGEGYVKYNKAASIILEAEYQRQGRNGNCSPLAGYTVNFASMEQTNDATSYTRRIARIVRKDSNPIPSRAAALTTASSISSGIDLDSEEELTLQKTPFHVTEAIPLSTRLLPLQVDETREKLDGTSHALKEGTDTWTSAKGTPTIPVDDVPFKERRSTAGSASLDTSSNTTASSATLSIQPYETINGKFMIQALVSQQLANRLANVNQRITCNAVIRMTDGTELAQSGGWDSSDDVTMMLVTIEGDSEQRVWDAQNQINQILMQDRRRLESPPRQTTTTTTVDAREEVLASLPLQNEKDDIPDDSRHQHYYSDESQ